MVEWRRMCKLITMRKLERSTASLLIIFLYFVFSLSIQRSAALPSITDGDISAESKDISSLRDAASCNGSCVTYTSGECVIDPNFCFIGGQCYPENQTASVDSDSCLQCLPEPDKKETQTQWSFNKNCSAEENCENLVFRGQNSCEGSIVKEFYEDPDNAMIKNYDFVNCAADRRKCQPGFFQPKNGGRLSACCAGHFCPDGQTCMIPCRRGSYCPSPLTPFNGLCQSSVKCPVHQPSDFGQIGCGGSIIEGFCPAGSYCKNASFIESCPNKTNYCPTGVQKALNCPSGFVCLDGRARRTRLITSVLISVIVILIAYGILAGLSPLIEDKLFKKHTIVDPPGVSKYFRKSSGKKSSSKQLQLHIHLQQARLRNVTRFDVEKNEGFTGRITAGKITALMGGSGCGKSSLLETIHGRRQLQENGYITFAEHEPLSNRLTDYIGYVPQADIMHNDLTVFETVYYSARTRRLRESQSVIKNDVCFVLQRLGLGTMHNNMTATLSGGQRKRVNVAMEVAACPKVILLDEPTSGLDTVSCDDLFDLLQLIKYSAAGPVAIITVIHQPSQELFEKIDEIFFLTPLCCLAYQGPRDKAKEFLKKKIFTNPRNCPTPRHNDCDTCFIMLTEAKEHVDNHKIEHERISQHLSIHPLGTRAWLPFLYVLLRSLRQTYLRGAVAEAAYLFAYFLLGACLGYLFENKQQGTCDIKSVPTIYFLISLAFGILTCISSQRLFGVEITDHTFERESRNYFHPFQYWLAKSVADIFRLLFYPLVFLSMLYIEVVPRGSFSFYYGVMVLLSFVCSGIGQLTSVIFDRTEYAYLAGTIAALVSCLLSGFSPTKTDLGAAKFIVPISFSRHIQHLLFRHETALYDQSTIKEPHIWSTSVGTLNHYYSYESTEHPYLWLFFIGFLVRALTFLFLYAKSEYRSKTRFKVTHAIPTLKSYLTCEPCRQRTPARNKYEFQTNETT